MRHWRPGNELAGCHWRLEAGRRMTRETLPDPILVSLDFASILDRLEAPYLVGGSLASSMHGEPRSTLDVDFVVDLDVTKVESLVAELQTAYYVDVRSGSRPDDDLVQRYSPRKRREGGTFHPAEARMVPTRWGAV